MTEKGKSVTVHYRGTLADGTEFDSSRKHGEPFTFRLGAGEVIPGWDEGVQGMKVGGKRKLVVPPGMGYGSQGVPGAIPPNATLTFEVDCWASSKAAQISRRSIPCSQRGKEATSSANRLPASCVELSYLGLTWVS